MSKLVVDTGVVLLHSAAVASMEVSLGGDGRGGSESLVGAGGGAGWMYVAGPGTGWVAAGDGD